MILSLDAGEIAAFPFSLLSPALTQWSPATGGNPSAVASRFGTILGSGLGVSGPGAGLFDTAAEQQQLALGRGGFGAGGFQQEGGSGGFQQEGGSVGLGGQSVDTEGAQRELPRNVEVIQALQPDPSLGLVGVSVDPGAPATIGLGGLGLPDLSPDLSGFSAAGGPFSFTTKGSVLNPASKLNELYRQGVIDAEGNPINPAPPESSSPKWDKLVPPDDTLRQAVEKAYDQTLGRVDGWQDEVDPGTGTTWRDRVDAFVDFITPDVIEDAATSVTDFVEGSVVDPIEGVFDTAADFVSTEIGDPLLSGLKQVTGVDFGEGGLVPNVLDAVGNVVDPVTGLIPYDPVGNVLDVAGTASEVVGDVLLGIGSEAPLIGTVLGGIAGGATGSLPGAFSGAEIGGIVGEAVASPTGQELVSGIFGSGANLPGGDFPESRIGSGPVVLGGGPSPTPPMPTIPGIEVITGLGETVPREGPHTKYEGPSAESVALRENLAPYFDRQTIAWNLGTGAITEETLGELVDRGWVHPDEVAGLAEEVSADADFDELLLEDLGVSHRGNLSWQEFLLSNNLDPASVPQASPEFNLVTGSRPRVKGSGTYRYRGYEPGQGRLYDEITERVSWPTVSYQGWLDEGAYFGRPSTRAPQTGRTSREIEEANLRGRRSTILGRDNEESILTQRPA